MAILAIRRSLILSEGRGEGGSEEGAEGTKTGVGVTFYSLDTEALLSLG